MNDSSAKTNLHNHNQNIEKILEAMPQEKDFFKASDIFQQLCDPTRLRILWLLAHSEECVNNIAVAVNMSSPAVSHHLRLLKQAGLISSRRLGKEIHYKLSDTPEAQLLHRSIDDIFDIRCPRYNRELPLTII